MGDVLINGAMGEGGGQILRTSLVLSAICDQPICIEQIRANRDKPGLRPQHLTGVKAMASLCEAHLEGGTLGSSALRFVPTRLPAGDHVIDIGTAGATSLLLHAIYFAMAWGEGGRLDLRGGTHAERAPSFDYIEEVWTPTMSLCGFDVQTGLQSYGFYPKGGGRIEATIPGAQRGRDFPFSWHQRPPLDAIHIRALWAEPGASKAKKISDIPRRMADSARQTLLDEGIETQFHIDERIAFSHSHGAVCSIFCHFGPLRAGFTAWGRKGVPSERVGQMAAEEALAFLDTEACLDSHLADQVLLPLALAGRDASFTTPECTGHLETNAAIIQTFLPDLHIDIQSASNGLTTVRIASK